VFSLPSPTLQHLFSLPYNAVFEYTEAYTKYLRKKGPGALFKFSSTDEVILFLLWFHHYIRDILLITFFFKKDKTLTYHSHTRLFEWFYDITQYKIQFHILERRMNHRAVQILNDLFSFAIDGSEQCPS
jgi:hypothetical protein